MKKLQNNFTTPEQSKRLLELGVPAYSADCVLENLDTAENNFQSKDYTRWIIEKRHVKEDIFCEINEGIFLPCWSVGRLIEIICNCHIITHQLVENWICCDKDTNLIELLMSDIDVYIAAGHIDFSKLEED